MFAAAIRRRPCFRAAFPVLAAGAMACADVPGPADAAATEVDGGSVGTDADAGGQPDAGGADATDGGTGLGKPACGPVAPASPTPTQRANGVLIEASDFEGGWVRYTNVVGYYGDGAMGPREGGLPSGPTVETRVDLAPGEYGVWTRAYADASDRRLIVEIDGSPMTATHAPATKPAFRWERNGTIAHQGGELNLAVREAGDSIELLDAVMFVTPADAHPSDVEANWLVFAPGAARDCVMKAVLTRAREVRTGFVPPDDLAEWQRARDALRTDLQRILGLDPLPDRGPLNAQVVGAIPLAGYRIERVIFNSRPDFPVTANVYIPDGPGPFPVVLSPIGHYDSKEDAAVVPRAHGLAQLGIISIVYDPFGQGERRDPANGHGANWALALTGRSNMTLMLWDTMRALDYLETRPEADTSAAVVTGASGGGLNAFLLTLVDNRLAGAVPTVYVSEFEDFMATELPHDPCTAVPGLAGAVSQGMIAALFAPKPLLMMAGSGDAEFPAVGSQRVYDQAQPYYQLYDEAPALRLEVFRAGHVYSRSMREHLYGFAARWQLAASDDSPIPEPGFVAPDEGLLQCFENGFVPTSSASASDWASRWADDAIRALPEPGSQPVESLRSALQGKLRMPAMRTPPRVEARGSFASPAGQRIEKYAVEVRPDLWLSALVRPGRLDAKIILVSKDHGLSHGRIFDSLPEVEETIVFAPVRGHGESQFEAGLLGFYHVMLGDALVGQQASDLLRTREAFAAFGRGRRKTLLLSVSARSRRTPRSTPKLCQVTLRRSRRLLYWARTWNSSNGKRRRLSWWSIF